MKPMDRERFEQDDVTRAACVAVKDGKIRVQDILKDGAYWYCFNEGTLHGDTAIDRFIETYTTDHAPIARKDAKAEISYTDPVGAGRAIDLIGVLFPSDALQGVLRGFYFLMDKHPTRP